MYSSLNLRLVPTKWETSCKFMRDKLQIHFQAITRFMLFTLPALNFIFYVTVVTLFGVQNLNFHKKSPCFLLIFEMFDETCLLQFSGNLSFILWEQVMQALPVCVKKRTFLLFADRRFFLAPISILNKIPLPHSLFPTSRSKKGQLIYSRSSLKF